MSGEFRVGSAPAGRLFLPTFLADGTEEITQSGYLNRKTVQEARGRKSKDRSWQTLWCSLKGSTLEFHRVDGVQPKAQGDPPPRDVYPPPNSVKYKVGFVQLEEASVQLDYVSQMNKDLHKRRQHLFRLTLQNELEYLMQAPSSNIKNNWVVSLQSAAQQKMDVSDSLTHHDTKIKAARCSIKNRSRTNVHSIKRHPFMTSHSYEEAAIAEPLLESLRQDPRLAVIKRRLQDKKTLSRQISKMYTSFMGGTAAMYCDMQMHFDTSPDANCKEEGTTTAIPAMTRSKVVHRRMSLPESQHLRAGGGDDVDDDDRRASTGEMAVPIIEPASPSSSSFTEGLETVLLLDYYLVPGAKWSQLKLGETVKVLGKCANGWYRCMACRSATFQLEEVGTGVANGHGEMSSVDSGLPPSEGLSSIQNLQTVQEGSPEVGRRGGEEGGEEEEEGEGDSELDCSLQLSYQEPATTIAGAEDDIISRAGITKLSVTLKDREERREKDDEKLSVVLRKKDHRKSCERPLSYQLATEELSLDFEEQIMSSPEHSVFLHSTPTHRTTPPVNERLGHLQRKRSESQPVGSDIPETLLTKLRDARLNALIETELESGKYTTPLVGCIPPSALKYFADKMSLKPSPSQPSPPSPPSQRHSSEQPNASETNSENERQSFAYSEDSFASSSLCDSGNFESSATVVASSVLTSSLIAGSIIGANVLKQTGDESPSVPSGEESAVALVEGRTELRDKAGSISIEVDDVDQENKERVMSDSMDTVVANSNVVVTFQAEDEGEDPEQSIVPFRLHQSRAHSLPPPTITHSPLPSSPTHPPAEQDGSERCYDDEDEELDGESSLDRCSRTVRSASSRPEGGTKRSHSLNAPSILRATQSAHTSPARKPTSPSSARKRAASKPVAKRVTSHDPPPSSSSYAEHRPSLFRKLFPRRRSGKSSPSHSKQSHYINLPPADTDTDDAPLPNLAGDGGERSPSPRPPHPSPRPPHPSPVVPLPLNLKAILGEESAGGFGGAGGQERARVSSVSGRVVRKAGVGLVFGESSSESESEDEEEEEEERLAPSPLGYRDDSVFSSPTFEQHDARLKRNRSAENIHRLASSSPDHPLSSATSLPPASRMKKSASEHDSLKLKTLDPKDPPPSKAVSLRRNLTFNTHFKMPTLKKDTVPRKSKTLKKLRTLRKKSSTENVSTEEPDSATKLTGIFRSPPRGEQRFVYLDPLETKYGFRLQSYGRLRDKGKVLQTFVENVTPGSPSFMAGLYPGDSILEVNGQDVKYAPVEDVVEVIMGVSKSNNYKERIQLVVEFVDGVTRLNCMKTADELKTQIRGKQAQLRQLLNTENSSSNNSNRHSTASSSSSSSLPSPAAIVQPEDLTPWGNSSLTFMPGARPFSHNKLLNSVISLNKGGITALSCDALVVPISSCRKPDCSNENVLLQLLHTGGEGLRNELSLAKQCRLGQNIVTAGHRLHVQKIYHCVFGDLEESLQSCCTNALESASEEQLRRIAFWMDGFVSIQVSPHLVIEAVRQWFQQGNNYCKFDHIVFSATVNLEIISMFLDKYFPLKEYSSGSDYSLELGLSNGTGSLESKLQNGGMELGNNVEVGHHAKMPEVSLRDIGLLVFDNDEISPSPCGTSILESESDDMELELDSGNEKLSDIGDDEPTPKIAKKFSARLSGPEEDSTNRARVLSTIFSASATSDCVLNEDSGISHEDGGSMVDTSIKSPTSPLVLNPDRLESDV